MVHVVSAESPSPPAYFVGEKGVSDVPSVIHELVGSAYLFLLWNFQWGSFGQMRIILSCGCFKLCLSAFVLDAHKYHTASTKSSHSCRTKHLIPAQGQDSHFCTRASGTTPKKVYDYFDLFDVVRTKVENCTGARFSSPDRSVRGKSKLYQSRAWPA